HTRSKRDWSSDMCSSDLPGNFRVYQHSPCLIVTKEQESDRQIRKRRVYWASIKETDKGERHGNYHRSCVIFICCSVLFLFCEGTGRFWRSPDFQSHAVADHAAA